MVNVAFTASRTLSVTRRRIVVPSSRAHRGAPGDFRLGNRPMPGRWSGTAGGLACFAGNGCIAQDAELRREPTRGAAISDPELTQAPTALLLSPTRGASRVGPPPRAEPSARGPPSGPARGARTGRGAHRSCEHCHPPWPRTPPSLRSRERPGERARRSGSGEAASQAPRVHVRAPPCAPARSDSRAMAAATAGASGDTAGRAGR